MPFIYDIIPVNKKLNIYFIYSVHNDVVIWSTVGKHFPLSGLAWNFKYTKPSTTLLCCNLKFNKFECEAYVSSFVSILWKKKKTKNFDKLQNNQSTYLLKHQQNKYFFLRYSTYFYGGISTSKKHSSLSVWWVLRKCIECCHRNVVLQNPTRFSHLYLTWWTLYLMWNISCL